MRPARGRFTGFGTIVTRGRPLLASAALALVLVGCSDGPPGERNPTEEGNADVPTHRVMSVGPGWARTSVNAPIFRKDALTSDDTHQYTSAAHRFSPNSVDEDYPPTDVRVLEVALPID